jgi:hypothetical protein
MITCTAKIALTIALAMPQSQPASYSGYAASYAKGVMEHVADVRGIARQPCMVASWRLPLERWVVVRGQRTGVRRRCLVVDVCRPGRDCARIRRKHIVVELDWSTNKAICGASKEPPSYCPVTVFEVPR